MSRPFIHKPASHLHLLTDILKDVDNEEGCDEIVDALDVPAGGMPNGPDEQNPLKDLKKKAKSINFLKMTPTAEFMSTIQKHKERPCVNMQRYGTLHKVTFDCY